MDEPNDLRATLEAAVAKESAEPTKEAPAAPASEAKPAEPAKPDVTPAVEDKAAVAKDDAPPPETKPAAEKAEVPVKPEEPATKAPAPWRAGAKERWKDVPAEVQQEVIRREREAAVAIQQNSEARKFADAFNQVIQPFQGIMAAEGAKDPLSAVQGLMQTAASLRLGTPIQKANVIAQLISVYGVDIQTLDGVLSGQQDPKIQQQSEIERLLQERLAPYQQFMEQQRQQQAYQQQTVQQQAAQVVEQFAAKAEFLDDPEITNTMADLLEMSAKRGRTMTMEQAYDQAVKLHPDISKIMAQREAAKKAAASATSRAAASSVSGSPAGGGPPSGGGDIRSAIMAAMER
jgi:hypothetical protein